MKFRVSAMLGFKSFRHARQVLPGIELIQKLEKGQYDVPFSLGVTSREIWRGFSLRRCDRTLVFPCCKQSSGASRGLTLAPSAI